MTPKKKRERITQTVMNTIFTMEYSARKNFCIMLLTLRYTALLCAGALRGKIFKHNEVTVPET